MAEIDVREFNHFASSPFHLSSASMTTILGLRGVSPKLAATQIGAHSSFPFLFRAANLFRWSFSADTRLSRKAPPLANKAISPALGVGQLFNGIERWEMRCPSTARRSSLALCVECYIAKWKVRFKRRQIRMPNDMSAT